MRTDRVPWRKQDKRLAVVCGLSWVVTFACWLMDVAGGGGPAILARGAVVATLVVTAVGVSRLAFLLWTGAGGATGWSAPRILLLLVVLALAVRWIGVDWEVTGRYYRDEGIYYAAANDINSGQLFPKSFIYGHLPYYIYALALWIQALFPEVLAWLSGAVFGLGQPVDVSWILLRGIDTTLGALTTIPVFVIGQRVAGRAAAVIGSLLIIFSPIYNEITRLIISDVPSAFFAALCLMFVARLLDEERYGPYLMAGAAAGLAAASKYPAGVVAIAIVGVWIAWRIRARRWWSWHLLAAGVVSLLTFLAVMPAFWAHSEAVFVGQGKDLLFGFRQYGRGGWIGVMPTSNAQWYGEQLLTSFGVPVIVLGLVGWTGLDREARRRLLWMLPFPVVFLALLAAMSMVVKRNLLPVLPALAALLGVGMAGWLQLVRRRRPAALRWVSVLLAAALALPIYRTTVQTIAYARDSTREQAVAWIDAHVPRGAAIIKESYTPHLHKKKYTVHQTRFAPRLPMEEMRSGAWDYLLLSRNAYGRFLDPQNWSKPHHELFARAYEEMLQFELVEAFFPGRTRMGPSLELFAVDPRDRQYRDRYRFAFDGDGFRYPRDDAYLLLKEYMLSGRYRLTLDTVPPAVDGRVEPVARDNRVAGTVMVVAGQGDVELPWQAKYFFYIYLPEDTEIRAMELTPVD